MGRLESKMTAAWEAWLQTLEAKGVAAQALLRPGASEEQISELEQTVGARLPQEARELYLMADGQDDIFKVETVAAGKVLAPLFGGYEFNTLNDVAAQWAAWRDIREHYTPAELDENFNDSVEVRGHDPVRKLYTHESWIPFATDGGGNSLALDLDPAAGGTRGQIIVIGSDEDQRRVLAPGLTAFLANLATMLEVGRLTIDPCEDEDRPIAFFDVEPGLLQ